MDVLLNLFDIVLLVVLALVVMRGLVRPMPFVERALDHVFRGGYTPPKAYRGSRRLAGKVARVRRAFAPEDGISRGTVFIAGEIWSAFSASAPETLRSGVRCRVVARDGRVLQVEHDDLDQAGSA